MPPERKPEAQLALTGTNSESHENCLSPFQGHTFDDLQTFTGPHLLILLHPGPNSHHMSPGEINHIQTTAPEETCSR